MLGTSGRGEDRLRANSERGLFVIGHARSGTTVLQAALNEAREIFLFGEAELQHDPGTPDFRARYNRMQRSFGNQETKGSYCPALFDGDARWDAYLAALLDNYRYVGAKLVINPDGAAANADRLFDFATRHFYRAHYVFCFRNPIDVVCSTQGLSVYQGLPPQDTRTILAANLDVIRLYLRMLRNVPNVHVVFHEAVSPLLFETLGNRLGLELGHACRYYSEAQIRRYRPADVIGGTPDMLDQVSGLYAEFRRQASSGFERIQIEQNSTSLDPNHPTPLGRLYWTIETAAAGLANAAE